MTVYLIERLPERLAAKITVNPGTGCWEWQGRRDKSGYGQVKWERRVRRVHRLVFELLDGPIPNGAWLDHVQARGCRSRACCWPAHLEPVTPLENTLRGDLPLITFEPAATIRDELRALRGEVAEMRSLLRDVAARLPLPATVQVKAVSGVAPVAAKTQLCRSAEVARSLPGSGRRL